MMLSVDDEIAVVKIQCAVRSKLARNEKKLLHEDWVEEEKWRQALKRRRERIERLEKELRHVEEMPAAAVDKYSTSARYGRNNQDAAARTIQGLFRSVVRRKAIRQNMATLRGKAAQIIQHFVQRTLHRREKVAELQAVVLTRLEERKKARYLLHATLALMACSGSAERTCGSASIKGHSKTSEDELRDLAERAKASLSVYKNGLRTARGETLSRVQIRQETATVLSHLWGCRDLDMLLKDRNIQSNATGHAYSAIPQPSHDYMSLIQQVAANEHASMLAAVRDGLSSEA